MRGDTTRRASSLKESLAHRMNVDWVLESLRKRLLLLLQISGFKTQPAGLTFLGQYRFSGLSMDERDGNRVIRNPCGEGYRFFIISNAARCTTIIYIFAAGEIIVDIGELQLLIVANIIQLILICTNFHVSCRHKWY